MTKTTTARIRANTALPTVNGNAVSTVTTNGVRSSSAMPSQTPASSTRCQRGRSWILTMLFKREYRGFCALVPFRAAHGEWAS